jgi:hypothetical protein
MKSLLLLKVYVTTDLKETSVVKGKVCRIYSSSMYTTKVPVQHSWKMHDYLVTFLRFPDIILY